MSQSRASASNQQNTLLAALAGMADRIILLEGWSRRWLAFSMGVVAALALQPFDALPAFLVAFPVLVWLLDGTAHGGWRGNFANLVAAAGIGWWFGFGYCLAGLWWLGQAFITGGEDFIWLMPLGVVGLPMALAFFFAFGLALARLFWCGGGARLFALAFGLGASEWLRATLFTGFPWNGFGQAFANHITLVQAASLIGAEGLGVLAIVMFAAPATLATGRTAFSRWFCPVLALLALLALAVFGLLRLQIAGGARVDFSTLATVPNVRLRIMQPNIAQTEKNKPGSGPDLLERYLKLSDRAAGPQAMGLNDVTHLIWPEAPLPFVLDKTPKALETLARTLPAGTKLITGAIRREAVEGDETRQVFFNALQYYEKGALLASYDKVHLVPFGEYLPFAPVLRRLGLEEFVHVVGGFTAGAARTPLLVPGLPMVVPLICFESIFPHDIAALEDGNGLFLNVTNDAWFGETPGPYQHLAQARLRAIEFGLPLVRAANTGISAVYDGYGRMVASLPLGVADSLDSPLPVGLSTTFYRRTVGFSYASVMICFMLTALSGLIRKRRHIL